MNNDRSAKQAAVWPVVARMTARALTALFGGYAAAAALASLLARLLPIAPAEASAWGMILSFLVFAGLALWAFHERRLTIVAAAIWGSALIAGAAVVLMGARA
ncbi:hypothetical protein [Caulobacter endophyticus]|uniref:hypothetical protein n=1 Tax=Caulobacter endophyticus TaxID=2172652 RepID=UPI00240EE098|nr:hypothetical protein [Caulobacter endophyticus]MDG2527204.1 hypothetical protein [Caulobacter endophyticus]